nr:MAG TPA: hypothetical protein [Caudoviricetes sp.]
MGACSHHRLITFFTSLLPTSNDRKQTSVI